MITYHKTLWIGTAQDCGGDFAPSEEEWTRFVALVRKTVGSDVEIVEGARPGYGVESALVVDRDGNEDDDEADALVAAADAVWQTGDWVTAD